MSNEGNEGPNPKQARLKRIQDSNVTRGSIGNFSQTYSVRGRALSDDESSKPMTFEESESETKSYSFQFEKGDKDQDPVKGADDGAIDRTLYAKLTESVQEQLDSVDEQLERVKNGTSTIGELGSFIDKIVIRQRSPVLEFDDIDGLRNYNLDLVRFSPGSRPVATEAGNTLVFNNQTNLVSIELTFTDAEKDEEGAIIAAGTTSHVIKSLLRARRDDIFTFVSAAQAPYTNCVLTATAADNTIQFVDVSKGEILFKVPVHNGQTVRTVIAASASASLLAVGFDDFGIQVYEIESGKLLQEYQLQDESGVGDFIQFISFTNGATFRVTTNKAIFTVNPTAPDSEIKRAVLEPPAAQQPAQASDQLLRTARLPSNSLQVFAGQGTDAVHSVLLIPEGAEKDSATGATLVLEKGQKVLDMTLLNPTLREFVVLVEVVPERPKAVSVHAPLVAQKLLVVVAVVEDNLVAVDSIPTFEEAVSVSGISSGEHIVVEVYCLNDKKLHAQIKEGLTHFALSGSADTRQISTKEDSNSSSRRGSAAREGGQRVLCLKMDQPASPLVAGYQGLSSEELSKLIEDKVSQMKESLRVEIMDEIKNNLKSFIEEQVKASVAEELEKIKQNQTA